MAYRLADDETVGAGVRRCADEQLGEAIEQLTTGVGDEPVTAIHEARKCLKKQRAVLRMARPEIGKRAYREERIVIRDAGRRLGGAREADVALQAVEALAERYVGQVPQATWDRLRDALATERDLARRDALHSGITPAVVRDLRQARERIGVWDLDDAGRKLAERALDRSYRDGRRAYRDARDGENVEALHEARKRTKDLWYHVRLARDAWPGALSAEADEVHRLTELIGDHHDLAQVRGKLTGDPQLYCDVPADLDPVVELVDRRRAELLGEIRALAERVYAEKPKARRRRLARYWDAWESERERASLAVAV
jgi:CHAD domain-containing protein